MPIERDRALMRLGREARTTTLTLFLLKSSIVFRQEVVERIVEGMSF
jgi:hypothetical protein